MLGSDYVRRKIFLPLINLIKQGLTPSKLALVMAIGMTISVFPVLGLSTLVCTLLAIILRLNLPAIHVANCIAFPIQILLFFPFLKIGETLSGVTLETITRTNLPSILDAGLSQATAETFRYIAMASYGWILTAAPLFTLFFYLFWIVFKRYEKHLVLP